MVKLNGSYYLVGREIAVLLPSTKELPIKVFYAPRKQEIYLMADIEDSETATYTVNSVDHENDFCVLNMIAVLSRNMFVEWDTEITRISNTALFEVRESHVYNQREINALEFEQLPVIPSEILHDGRTEIKRLL